MSNQTGDQLSQLKQSPPQSVPSVLQAQSAQPMQPMQPTQSTQPTQPTSSSQSPEQTQQTLKEESPLDKEESQRFEVELEFVQCLASPSYLNFLAQNEFFDSPDFIAYLKYLQYWRTPPYARFVVFPHALYFLHLLQERTFRDAIKRSDYTLMVHQQQGFHWQFSSQGFKQKIETMNSSTPNDEGAEVSTNPAANAPSQAVPRPPSSQHQATVR